MPNTESRVSLLQVGISDAKFSNDPNVVLITYALGSCLGLTVYDPQKKIGGLLHCLLPLSSADAGRARENPFLFVDSGIAYFLNRFFTLGGDKDRMIVKASGCGNMQDANNHFNIGQRNHTVLRKILWKNNILIASELIGGADAKTLSLSIATGQTCVKTSQSFREI